MRRFLSVVIVLLATLFIIHPPTAFAHAGGGPPFIKINNEFVKENPYFQGLGAETGLTIPQDLAKSPHVVKTPLTVQADPSILGVPPEVSEKATFTWKIEKGENFATLVKENEKGLLLTFTPFETGSYLITFSMLPPNVTEVLVLDTIQVNVVPQESYAIPTPHIIISAPKPQSGENVTFQSTISGNTAGAPYQYLWDFGGKNLKKGERISYVFEDYDGFYLIFHRIVDTYGIVSDAGLFAQTEGGSLSFSPLVTTEKAPFTLHAPPANTFLSFIKNPLILTLIVICSVLIVGSLIFIFQKKRKKRK